MDSLLSFSTSGEAVALARQTASVSVFITAWRLWGPPTEVLLFSQVGPQPLSVYDFTACGSWSARPATLTQRHISPPRDWVWVATHAGAPFAPRRLCAERYPSSCDFSLKAATFCRKLAYPDSLKVALLPGD